MLLQDMLRQTFYTSFLLLSRLICQFICPPAFAITTKVSPKAARQAASSAAGRVPTSFAQRLEEPTDEVQGQTSTVQWLLSLMLSAIVSVGGAGSSGNVTQRVSGLRPSIYVLLRD